MEILKYVKFDRQERAVLEAAARSVTIAFEAGDEADEARKPLNGLINGGEGHERSLERAFKTLSVVLTAISEDIVHYSRLRDDPPPGEIAADGTVPVIADTRQMASVLAEAREMQRAEVVEAMMLVRKAQRTIWRRSDPRE
jgi:hypothetical protein